MKVMQLLDQPGKGLWPQFVYPSPFPFTKSLPEARTPAPPPPPPCCYTPVRWALEVKKDGDPKMHSHHSDYLHPGLQAPTANSRGRRGSLRDGGMTQGQPKGLLMASSFLSFKASVQGPS